ncbi:MAG: M23 family metallopeptidase [candidate division WOR-3 bacterium]|nr:MAG: M23 family metallopeptidase [candidate division WOR-3 bacterium]
MPRNQGTRERRRRSPASATMTIVGVLAAVAVLVFLLRIALKRAPIPFGPELPRPDSVYCGGDTMRQYEVFSTMLARMSVPSPVITEAKDALSRTDFNFRRLKPGDSVTLKYRGLQLVGLSYHLDMVTSYQVDFDSAGTAVAAKTVREVDTVRSAVSGTVAGSFWNSLLGMGEEPWLAMRFTEILRYDVDFFTESNDGDSFELLFDRLMVGGTFYRYGRVHAVHYKGRTDNTYGFYYRLPNGHWDHYNEKGQSLRKTVLRSPLEFKKVTSYFGNRFHPIHRVWRPHQGVDYAAPRGTPVSCVADGQVTVTGWLGGYGRLVEVTHRGGLKSRYGHLSGFGPGVRQGRRARQGQTIGYIGSTGDATGPHLHFEIRKGGKPVNPLRIIPPRADPVPKKYMADFKRVRDTFIGELRRISSGPPVPDSAAVAESATR